MLFPLVSAEKILMVLQNETDVSYTEEEEYNTFTYPFMKWNCHKIIIDHFNIVY